MSQQKELLTLDLSTTETGYCIGADKPVVWGVIKPKSSLDLEARNSYIAQEVSAMACDDIVAEALHYARGMKTVRALFMLHGAVQQTLMPKRITWMHQASVYKVLGLGKQDKNKGLAYVNKMGYKTRNLNESDAILMWLACRKV